MPEPIGTVGNKMSVRAPHDRGLGKSSSRAAGLPACGPALAALAPIALAFTALFLSLSPSDASDSSPAFDCDRATLPIQKLICADPELSKLDVAVARAYAVSISRANPSDIKDLQTHQQEWLRKRNGCSVASDARSCALDAYKTRLSEL